MEQNTIIIEEGDDDMLSIEYKGKSLFYGNVWDFHVGSSTFKEMFKALGFNVTLRELPSEEDA